jgi:hypothetical protein
MKEEYIELLQEVKREIDRIQNEIIKESDKIGALLKKISKYDDITFDSDKHSEMKRGIASYVNSLNEIMKIADHNIEHCQELHAEEVKRFCKKMKKDIAVSYSRFCFGFETQKRQLEYLDKILSKK